MPFDPPPLRHPTLAEILANPTLAEFHADVRPDMDRRQVGEIATRWLGFVDDEYADGGIDLTVADLNHAQSALIEMAFTSFDATAQAEADELRDGWLAGDLTRDGRAVPMPRYAAV